MIILGIETSCDETSVSIIKTEKNNIRVLSNVVSSQVKLHKKWGGVVPNLAAREHLKNILPVLEEAFFVSRAKPEQIDLISATSGPGLIPALLIGVNAARTLSYIWQKPLLGIHHIEGHIYANFIGDKIGGISNFKFKISKQNQKCQMSNVNGQMFPILCLVVSGGHTQLVLMKNHLDYQIIGETLDDASGEAFDKVARILGLGYPGGPAIAAKAAKFNNCHPEFISGSKIKNKEILKQVQYDIRLPRPMLNKNNFDFSFSGLKTAVLYKVKELEKLKPMSSKLKASLCHEFQQAVIDVLVSKTIKAAKKYSPKTILLAGGVSANAELKKQMKISIKKELKNTLYMIPDTPYSIDNAAMIAAAGYFRWQKMNRQQKSAAKYSWKKLEADAGLKLK